MSIIISKSLIDALRKAVSDTGTQKEFADKVGIPQSNIGKYLSGQIQVMQERTFKKLLPFLDYSEEQGADSKNTLPFKSKLTVVMVDMFEELSKEGQRHILDLAEEEFIKEDTEIIELTYEEKRILGKRGIQVIDNVYGNFDLEISLLGLSWIYNLIYDALIQRNSIICWQESTPNFFRNLLEFEEDYDIKQNRNLMISYSKVKAYENNEYTVRSIYLEGSPPRLFSSHLIQQDSDIMIGQGVPFTVWEGSYLKLDLKEEEIKKLEAGETLKINCKQIFE